MLIHPMCDLVPRLTDEEFAALGEDIRKYGVREPVKVWNGYIVDGRHRWEICQRLGIDCPIQIIELPEGETVAEYVLSMNNRRSLTSSQRAALAAEFMPILEDEAKKRQASGVEDDQSRGRAIDHAAKQAKTNPTYVAAAKKIKDADPELHKKVLDGSMSIAEAKEQAKAKSLPPPPVEDHEIDGLNQAVTEPKVVAALRERAWFGEVVNQVHALKREILEFAKSEAGQELREQQIKTHFENIAAAIRFAEPFTACPLGADNCKRGCKACKGRRWLSKQQYEMLPKDVQ